MEYFLLPRKCATVAHGTKLSLEVIEMDSILLESVEGLGHSPFTMEPGEIWETLQAEKDVVSRELLTQAMVREGHPTLVESEAAEQYARELSWGRRTRLEKRLRELNAAQDRLSEGTYGRCSDCGERIDSKRLTADAAASRCIACQTRIENESAFSGESLMLLIH